MVSLEAAYITLLPKNQNGMVNKNSMKDLAPWLIFVGILIDVKAFWH